ncbi:MAG: glycosyl transferase family 2 [Acidobacteria bacterium]|nr:glycosyl transferase family 2 [Acidobacteriota bacterium]
MQKVIEREAHPEDAQEALGRIGAADVVLGVPTYNNRETVGRMAEASLRALSDGFAGGRVVIINPDGSSRDGTAEHLREIIGDRIPLLQVQYPVYPVDRLSAPLAGVPGRTEAALTIFRLARQLGAKACALLDAEVESITPEWIDRLTRPVLEGGVDLVVPAYRRQRFEGLINSGVLSPFARALFGKRLRQPAGADLGFSAALMDLYLDQTTSNTQRPPLMDPWSTVPAVIHGFRIGQSSLGPRLVGPREVPPDLSSTLREVLSNMFGKMELTAPYWQKARGVEAVPWFGPPLEIGAERSELHRKPMIDAFRQGCHDLLEIWRLFLPPATLLDLRRMERQPDGELRFADDLWARVVYDFALGYHLRSLGRDHLLQAITPLYLGWAASFTGEMQNADGMEVEARFERLSMQFDAQKRYLISRWRWPDKFSP